MPLLGMSIGLTGSRNVVIARILQPVPQQLRGHFRPVLQADVLRNSAHQHGSRECIGDIDFLEMMPDPDHQ